MTIHNLSWEVKHHHQCAECEGVGKQSLASGVVRMLRQRRGEPVSGQISAQKYSPTTKREKNSTYENPPSVDNAPQSSQETFLTDSVSTVSSTYSSEPFSTDPESQKMTDWNAATGLTNMDVGQAEGANLDTPSRFSSENFSLQSYSWNTHWKNVCSEINFLENFHLISKSFEEEILVLYVTWKLIHNLSMSIELPYK